MSGWREIDTDVFVWADCCNVYALRDGRRALLIDLGSGAALDALAALGVDAVDGIYFTHAHRDQCQGADRAAARGIPLHFPARAKSFVDEAERPDFHQPSPAWAAYPSRFHPPHPLPAALFDLGHYQSIVWGPYDLQVFEAPGHIDHQVAFRIDGPAGSWLCSGDALHSRGRIHEAYCLETDHYTGAGARQAAATLCALRNLRAAVLCPSHGPVQREGLWDVFSDTAARLHELADLKDTIVPRRPAVRRVVRPRAETFIQLSDHLWMWGNMYFLLSDDGPILMVDVQTKLPESWYEAFRAQFGDRPIERVLVSHYHYDHVIGVEDLRRHYPLECWVCGHDLADITEHPCDYARPWLNEPAHVDRVIDDGETFAWREYELTGYWFPGQTDYHAGYATTVDGRRVLFSGDNFYPTQQWGGTGGQCGYNGSHPRRWRYSAELVMRLAPEWVLASHMQPYEYRCADFEAIVDWSDRTAALMKAIAPDGNLERHHSPHFIEARPYVQPAAAQLQVELRLHNTYDQPLELAIRPRWPADLTSRDEPVHDLVPPGESRRYRFTGHAAQDLAGMRLITFDVTANGEPWGELVECYVRGAGVPTGQPG